MTSPFEPVREVLIHRTTTALQEHAINNRSALPPFRLPQVAQRIVAGLLVYTDGGSMDDVRTLGNALGRQGLALRSTLAAGQVLLAEALALPEAISESALGVADYTSLLAEAIAVSEQQEVMDQRQEIQLTLERTVQAQQDKEDRLRLMIQELSTPIIPIYSGILVLPLVGGIDSRRSQNITEQLLMAIAERQAEIVILDITGVPMIDTDVANRLLMTARAAGLLGAQVLLGGISAEIAQIIVQLGLMLEGIVTLANLQSGIEYALHQQGFGITPMDRTVHPSSQQLLRQLPLS